MKCSMATLIVLTYLVGGFGTFGWIRNHTPDWHDSDRDFGAVMFGFVWPLYWAGTVAIKVTAP